MPPNMARKTDKGGTNMRVVGLLSALGSCSGFAGDTPSVPETEIRISVAQAQIKFGGAILCSSDALEAALRSEPRWAAVTIDVQPDVSFALFTQVTWTIRKLGFEKLTVNGSVEPGWTLYPPQSGFDIDGCGQSEPEDDRTSKNDS